MARHIKSGDSVMVITGADKGKVGKVLRILTSKDKVVVEGVPCWFNTCLFARIEEDLPSKCTVAVPVVGKIQPPHAGG